MKHQFTLSTTQNTKHFICLSHQSSITIKAATLLSNSSQPTTLIDDAYLEINFTFTDGADKTRQWIKTQPLHLKTNLYQQQQVLQFDITFSSCFLINSNNFYDNLYIKLVVKNKTQDVTWLISYEANLLKPVN